MAEIIHLRPRQTELVFPPYPVPPDPSSDLASDLSSDQSPPRSPRARRATGPTMRSARRPLAPQTRRLEISPEAWAAAESGGPTCAAPETRREGLLETILVLLATIAFGLSWVVVEHERVEGPASGYDARGTLEPGALGTPIAPMTPVTPVTTGAARDLRPDEALAQWTPGAIETSTERTGEEERWRAANPVSAPGSSRP